MVVKKQNKKGVVESPQTASGAAFLILIISILIIFYILFLSPTDRASLLGSENIPGNPPSTSGGYTHLIGSTPLSQNIGELTYIQEATIEHALASFTIYTQTDANIIATSPSFEVTNSAYDTKSYSLEFSIDKRKTENVYLSYNVDYADGALLVYLNGKLLQEAFLNEGTPQPIELPANLLKSDNVVHFSVSSPGFAFWTVNKYQLSNIKVTGDITDSSNSLHTQNIYLSETEKNHAQKADLQFYPDCVTSAVGPLQASLNGRMLFNGLPDCGLLNFISIDPSMLNQGTNTLSFSSAEGNYIIDQVEMDVDLEDPGNPIYYFDLNEDLFVSEQLNDNYCGKVDGQCPAGCEAYDDKDCCFDDSSSNFWCDARPNNVRDRCVNQVLTSYTANCPSGYEDRNGNPATTGICGDDTDGFCPAGCSEDFDKDCCFLSNNNFWCDDIPFTGRDNTCTQAVSVAECNACPNGYYDSSNDVPNCPSQQTTQFANEDTLKSGIDIVLESYFVDQDYKQVDFVVNGFTIPVNTYKRQIYRNINQYVHEGTNSLEVVPRDDVAISQVRVVIE